MRIGDGRLPRAVADGTTDDFPIVCIDGHPNPLFIAFVVDKGSEFIHLNLQCAFRLGDNFCHFGYRLVARVDMPL